MIVSYQSQKHGIPVPPHLLAPAAVEAWDRDGFLVINDVVQGNDLARLRKALDDCGLTDEIDRAHAQVMRLDLTTLHPAFLELARDPRILGRVVPLIGPNVAIEHSKLSAQPHGPGGGVSWHQDLAFYPHTNSDVLAVMVMLDDASLDNGCMRMIPGSHLMGPLDHADDDGCFLGACREQGPWRSHPASVSITPKAGGISIHHGYTLHASGENRSGLPRRGLVLNYRAADSYQLADMVFADTGLIVSGAHQGDVRLEQGTFRLPRFAAHWGRQIHGSAWNQVGRFASDANRASGLESTGAVLPPVRLPG